jgi:acyl-CoA synthetase (NDP forming)
MLSPTIIDRIDRILPSYWSRSNPIDLVGERDTAIPLTVLEALIEWDGCDAVINLGIMGRRIMVKRFGESVTQVDSQYSTGFINQINDDFVRFEKAYIQHIAALMERHQKPIFGVSLLPDEKNQTVYKVAGYAFKGVFYTTPERAVKAFAKMVEYRQFLNRRQ